MKSLIVKSRTFRKVIPNRCFSQSIAYFKSPEEIVKEIPFKDPKEVTDEELKVAREFLGITDEDVQQAKFDEEQFAVLRRKVQKAIKLDEESNPELISEAPAHSVAHSSTTWLSQQRSLATDGVQVSFTFVDRSGKKHDIVTEAGKTITQAVREAGLRNHLMSSCGGVLGCTECLVMFSEDHYHKLTESTEWEDLFLLDVHRGGGGVSTTTRLGCQIRLSYEDDGMTIWSQQRELEVFGKSYMGEKEKY